MYYTWVCNYVKRDIQLPSLDDSKYSVAKSVTMKTRHNFSILVTSFHSIYSWLVHITFNCWTEQKEVGMWGYSHDILAVQLYSHPIVSVGTSASLKPIVPLCNTILNIVLFNDLFYANSSGWLWSYIYRYKLGTITFGYIVSDYGYSARFCNVFHYWFFSFQP